MNLHEHQAKTLFKSYDLPTSNFFVANTVEEAKELAKKLNVSKWVVKAQVHAGGRGKAGGVEVVESLDDVEIFAKKWLGKNLITYQTDKNGQPVNSILIEECTEILSELYLGVVVDRSTRSIVVMASPEGGVNIEEVAENNPEKIFKASVKIVEEASDDSDVDSSMKRRYSRTDRALFPSLSHTAISSSKSSSVYPNLVTSSG